MSEARKSPDAFAFQVMLVLCLIWGCQQVLIKTAAVDIAPVMQAALRNGIAATLVGLLVVWRGDFKQASRTWQAGLLAGALFGLEFLFIAEGLKLTSAAHMSVFLYTAPMFTALGLHFILPSERLRLLQWVGILLAFGGIVMAFAGGMSFAQMDAGMLLGDVFGVLAGMAWGATTVVIRCSRLSEAPASLTLFYQLAIGFAGLLLIALLSGQIGVVSLTPLAVGSVLFQAVVVSFISYLTWFWLLRKYLASNLAVFSFITPLFGVTFGVLLLDEPLSVNFVLGAVMVLAGVVLVSAEPWVKQQLRKWVG